MAAELANIYQKPDSLQETQRSTLNRSFNPDSDFARAFINAKIAAATAIYGTNNLEIVAKEIITSVKRNSVQTDLRIELAKTDPADLPSLINVLEQYQRARRVVTAIPEDQTIFFMPQNNNNNRGNENRNNSRNRSRDRASDDRRSKSRDKSETREECSHCDGWYHLITKMSVYSFKPRIGDNTASSCAEATF